jgi:dTDP-4-dehydrorhamnose 3,5-epimerase
MNVLKTDIEGLLILEPKVFGDARGFFYESFNQQVFNAATGLDVQFVQDNHSRSAKGVLRGLALPVATFCTRQVGALRAWGRVRCGGGHPHRFPTFGKWAGLELSEDNNRQFWIPPGFAHGFVTLTDSAAYYAPTHDRSILWSDIDIGIKWPDVVGEPQLSGKDAAAKSLACADVFPSAF